jgi:hypothetical protein
MRTLSLAFLVGAGAVVALGCSSKSKGLSSGAAGAMGSAGASGAAGANADASTGDASETGGGSGSAAAGTGAAGTSTAGAGGMAGTAGGTGAAGAGGAAGTGVTIVDVGLGFQDTSASVLTRNKHESRDGFYIQPLLAPSNARGRMRADTTFAATFAGVTTGSPLYMEDGPGGKGVFFVATTSNDVYALDETTGATVWKQNVGPAPVVTGVKCGQTSPVGIMSTPVIDAASRTIFVAGGIGDATGIMRHEVHALSVDTGMERSGWPVNVSALTAPGSIAFKTAAQNQRGALSLVNGVLYVPYGGHIGDCDQYRGWVVSIKIADPTQTGAWATGGIGEGIWAAGGMASAGDGVLAVTGNSTAGAVTHLDSEEVVHVRGMSQVDRATGIFFPGTWRDMDQADADFGSSSGVVFNVPGATPSTIMAAVAKNGLFFLLNPASLGGMDGQLAGMTVGGGVRTSLVAYRTTKGVYVMYTAQGALGYCPAGTAAQNGNVYTVAVAITPGSPATPKVAWCNGGGLTPGIATTSDGTHDAVVWINSGGYLYGLDGDTGVIVIAGDLPCQTSGMAAPIAVKGHIIQTAAGKLCSHSPH